MCQNHKLLMFKELIFRSEKPVERVFGLKKYIIIICSTHLLLTQSWMLFFLTKRGSQIIMASSLYNNVLFQFKQARKGVLNVQQFSFTDVHRVAHRKLEGASEVKEEDLLDLETENRSITPFLWSICRNLLLNFSPTKAYNTGFTQQCKRPRF